MGACTTLYKEETALIYCIREIKILAQNITCVYYIQVFIKISLTNLVIKEHTADKNWKIEVSHKNNITKKIVQTTDRVI